MNMKINNVKFQNNFVTSNIEYNIHINTSKHLNISTIHTILQLISYTHIIHSLLDIHLIIP